jgi:hypothetical protein
MMRRITKSKKTRKAASVLHSKKRMQQRYGINLTEEDITALGNMVLKGKTEFVMKKSNTRTIHKAIVNNIEVYFVYNKSCRRIATFLTEEQVMNQLKIEGYLDEGNN